MNDAQCEMLKKYVSHICIDGTHGTNGYDFELITLLILDDMRQGFPCSFLISNRTDHFVLEIFFAKIKEKVGEICPTVFMSDMAESFFNAWCNTFQSKLKHRLFCTWHVDRAWRRNLHKIQSREMRLEVYKTLRTLMEEKDVDAFNIMFNEVLKNFLENDITREFCKYFIGNYANCINSWAYCHRLQSGLNTNMHVESMHKTLKYIYLKGRNAKRLDKTIYALMRFIRDKLVDKLIVMNKGKLTSKLKDLRQRHKTSLSLSTATIIENESGYIVPSSSTHETYLIQENNTNCSYTFGDRLISRFGPVNWPPRSCDLTPLDYFLWGYVKSLVYADKPQTLDHLEDNIRRVIADIRPQMLEKVIENWTSRLDYIRASRGSHMPEIIFKMKQLIGRANRWSNFLGRADFCDHGGELKGSSLIGAWREMKSTLIGCSSLSKRKLRLKGRGKPGWWDFELREKKEREKENTWNSTIKSSCRF
ncbi:MULE domain-containing protein [Trichonephila clavipes]|nr:MULE domain-containing protein [Trichonephila clavipes]